jgi:hypothetical protein
MAELRVKETGTIKLFENDNTSSVTIASPASLGADRTITLPDASVTLASGTMLATDGSGASLTALDADNISAGTLAIARGGTGATTLAGAGLANTPSFSAYITANQDVTNATDTIMTFNAENYDTDSAFDTTTYRFTVPAGEGGKYFINGHVRGENTNSYDMILQINLNGAACQFKNTHHGSYDDIYITTIMALSATDYLELIVSQTSGSTQTYGSGTLRTEFSGFKLIGV